MLNGPGLISTPNIVLFGKSFAHARPRGNTSNWATSYFAALESRPQRKDDALTPPTTTEGYRR